MRLYQHPHQPIQTTAMNLLILVIKILITEQKVNFFDNICHICEKIERWLMQHR